VDAPVEGSTLLWTLARYRSEVNLAGLPVQKRNVDKGVAAQPVADVRGNQNNANNAHSPGQSVFFAVATPAAPTSTWLRPGLFAGKLLTVHDRSLFSSSTCILREAVQERSTRSHTERPANHRPSPSGCPSGHSPAFRVKAFSFGAQRVSYVASFSSSNARPKIRSCDFATNASTRRTQRWRAVADTLELDHQRERAGQVMRQLPYSPLTQPVNFLGRAVKSPREAQST